MYIIIFNLLCRVFEQLPKLAILTLHWMTVFVCNIKFTKVWSWRGKRRKVILPLITHHNVKITTNSNSQEYSKHPHDPLSLHIISSFRLLLLLLLKQISCCRINREKKDESDQNKKLKSIAGRSKIMGYEDLKIICDGKLI